MIQYNVIVIGRVMVKGFSPPHPPFLIPRVPQMLWYVSLSTFRVPGVMCDIENRED